MKVIFFALILFLLFNSSCQERNNDFYPLTEVLFTSNIIFDGVSKTKVSNKEWELNDKVGIFMIEGNSLEVLSCDVPYLCNEKELKAELEPIFFPIDGSKVDFIAYYPYANCDNGIIEIDLSQTVTDFLYSNNVVAVNKDVQLVDLQFSHQLTEVVFDIIPDNNISEEKLAQLEIRIKGLPTKARFNLLNNAKIEIISDSSGELLFPELIKNNQLYTTSSIIIPCDSYDKRYFEFKLGDNIYKETISSLDFIKGHSYLYRVHLKENSIEIDGDVRKWDKKILSKEGGDLINRVEKKHFKFALPITGTWINLAYKDIRNKYTNPLEQDNTQPDFWKAKVKELSSMGIEYLILMEVANEGKSYYPSKLMPPIYNEMLKSPVEVILDEAEIYGMKVFLSIGWAKDQDDNLLNPNIKARQLEIMTELALLYKDRKAFYGWYLPVENCICPIFPEQAVQSVNILTKNAEILTPGKRTLISPFGIGLSNFNDPNYEKQLSKLNVDIIAYQDEVGCLRDKFTLPRLKSNWKKIRDIHNRLNIELWANCETFTWEDAVNSRASALIPAAYSRLLSQQAAASVAGVDRIVAFMFYGIIEDPKSPFPLGQPIWSNKLYNDYVAWNNGVNYWRFLEASFMGKLFSSESFTLIDDSQNKLFDGKIAEENSNDSQWLKFEKGFHEIILDFGKITKVDNVMLRTLNYSPENIYTPSSITMSISNDGISYNSVYTNYHHSFPNNKHDAWIEGTLFENLNINTRYIRIYFEAYESILMDEIFINPITS